MPRNELFPLLKTTGLVCLGGLIASAVFYLKAARPLSRRLSSPPPAPAMTADTKPDALQADATPLADLSSNPRPVQVRSESAPAGDAAVPVSFTGTDGQYHDAVLAGLDAPDTFAQESALCDKLAEWIHRSPGSVEAGVNEISQRYGADTALRVTAQLWAEEDPEGAKEWALRSGNGGQRLKIIASVSYQLAQRDPRAAMENLRGELERTPYYEAAAAPLIASWARKDRVAALAWVNAQSEGDIRKQLIWQIERVGALARQP